MTETPNDATASAASEKAPDELKRKRVLIFIVAYDAETTIDRVLERIPAAVFEYDYEILIIDDHSSDATFERATQYLSENTDLSCTLLFNPVNQGYGGNQKLGYDYAIRNNFDAVALLHGDGQYAPELLEDLFLPILRGEAEAVFGTRMAKKGDALRGGMPLYKYLGNRILSGFQNALLDLGLSEYHSGYRVYSVDALRRIPFQYNTNDFHFDTEIIIQLWLLGARIREIPIPTYYGDEICHVNGIKYAWDVFRATIGVRLHLMSLCYARQYDIERPEEWYPPKFGFASSHMAAIESVAEGSRVLDVGCGQGFVGLALEKKGCRVTGVDDIRMVGECRLEEFFRVDLSHDDLPCNPTDFDAILFLDVLEHLDTHAIFHLLGDVRERAGATPPRVVITTPNIAFGLMRLLLLTGRFNYGKRGILDLSHQHLFTFETFAEMMAQAGYHIQEMGGIPAPFPTALGDNAFSRALVRLNQLFIRLWPALFSYQIFAVLRPLPTLTHLLQHAHTAAHAKREAFLEGGDACTSANAKETT